MEQPNEDLKQMQSALSSLQKQIGAELAAELLKQSIEKYTELLSLDKELFTRLQDIADSYGETVYTGDQFAEMMQKINNQSIIVYFKTANSFRVYDASKISTLLTNHLSADFRRDRQMFEVIPNHLPQKVVILCDRNITNHIGTIKNYVVEYLKSQKVTINDTDIKMFEDDTNLNLVEIIINGFYVSDFAERTKIVNGLMNFIDLKEKNSVTNEHMTRHMEVRREFIKFENNLLVTMPNCKRLVNGGDFEITDALVGVPIDCINIRGDTYVFNINGGIHITNNNNNTTNVTNNYSVDGGRQYDFGKYIKEEQPEWYIPGEWISGEILRQKYVEQFGEIAANIFAKRFKNKIYDESKRQAGKDGKVTKYLLYAFEDIKELD